MKKNVVLASVLALTVGLNTKYATAQQVKDLDAVTVTATLKKNKISTTGKSITVIEGKQFAQLPVNTLDELLKYIPGIEVQARGPLGSQADIVIRGGTFQQVLVLLDGVRLNDAITGHFNANLPVLPSNIERIELVRGATSSIYGSEAVGAVINIITKKYNNVQADRQSFSLEAGVTAGAYELLNAHANATVSNKNNAFSFGGQTIYTAGQPLRAGINGFVNNKTVNFNYSGKINNNLSLTAFTAVDERNFAAQNFYSTYLSDTATEKINMSVTQLQLLYKKNNWEINTQVGYKQTRDNFKFNPITVVPNMHTANVWQALVSAKTNICKNTAVVFGGNFISKEIESNDRGNHSLNQIAAFALIDHSFTSKLSSNMAVRVEHHSIQGTQVTPQLNVSFHQKNIQLRAGVGKTFRDADFTERYNNYAKQGLKSDRVGNPNLKPETALNYEAGVDYFAAEKTKFSATVFHRNAQDVIDFSNTAYADMPRKDNLAVGNYSYALAKNITKVKTSGIEADVHHKQSLANNNSITYQVGFTWLNNTTSDTIPSYYVGNAARFYTNGTISFESKYFNASIGGIYKIRDAQTNVALNAQLSETYFLLNTKLVAKPFGTNALQCFIQVDNALNASYTDMLGTKMPQRWVMGGLSFKL